MSTYPQSQRIRLRLTFKRILMNLKFPCSLTAQVKHDTFHDCKRLYELRNGECNINEVIDSELDAPYNVVRGRFEDKKIIINVFMSSSSGKVAAGSITFSLLGKEAGNSYDNVQFLQKCPDKQAKLYYSFSFQQLLGKGQRLDKTIIGELRMNERQSEDYNGSRKILSYNSLQSPQATRLSANKQFGRFRNDKSNLNESHVEEIYTMDKRESRNVAKDTSFTARQFGRQRDSLKQHRRSKSRSFGKNEDNTSNNNSSRQLPSPRRNNNASKFLDKDEGQIEELEKLKNKIKNMERNERSNVQILRETKDEAQRKKNKISQLQIVRTQLEETVRVKDQKLRKVQKQQKQLSEQCQSLNNQIKNAKMQNELRQNMSREQIRKLEEKYRQSQCQRQRITEEYNRSLKLYEEMEKKYQGTLKEKERAFSEEKNKFNKKIEILTSSIDQAKREIDALKSEGEEFIKQKKGFLESHKGLGDDLENYRTIVEQLENQIKGEAQVIKQLRGQAEIFKQNQVERQQLKKKINQLLLTNNSHLQKTTKHQKTLDQLQYKIKEQEEQLQRRATDKNQLNSKLTQLKKTYDTLKLSEEQKIKENQSLILLQNATNSRVNQLKSRLEVERRNLEQIQREYSSRESALIAEKDSIEGQNEEMRWQLQKQSSTLQQLNQHSRSLNDQIYKLKQELIDKTERIKRLEDDNTTLSTQQEHLTGNCTQIDTQRKEQQAVIKDLTTQIADSKKKNLRTEQELADLKQRLRVFQLTNKEKISQCERKLKELESNIKAKDGAIRSLEQQIKDRTDEVALQKQSNNMMGQDIMRFKDTATSIKKQMEGQEVTIIRLKQSESELRKTIQSKDQAIDKKIRQTDEITRRLGKLTEEYAQYKITIVGAMESFFMELLRQDEVPSPTRNPSKTRASFPDERLSNLELQVIQKRNQQASKIRAKALQSAQQKQIWQYELVRVKTNFAELQQTHTKELTRSKQQVKMLQTEILSKEEVHKQSLFKIQEQLELKQVELQEVKRELVKVTDHAQDLQSQQRILLTKYNALKEDNKECQQRMLMLRSAEIKGKSSIEYRTQQIEGHSQSQTLKYRKLLQESQRRVLTQEKEIHDRTDVIKRYQAEQTIMGYELEKAENKANQWTQRANSYQEALKESDRYGKEKDRQLKKLNENIQQLSAMLTLEKQRSQDYLTEKQEQSQIVADLTHDIQKLKDENAVVLSKSADLQNQLKAKLQSTKILNDKLLVEIKQLKQKVISASSQIQLKNFMVRQAQISSTLQREGKQELQQQLDKKKIIITKLNEQIMTIQNKYSVLEHKCNALQEQKDSITSNLDKNRQMVSQLKNSMDNSGVNDQVASLERQIDRLRSDKVDTENYYQRQVTDLKNMLKESKRMESSKTSRQEELKKRVKILQKMLENQNYDIATEKRKLLQEIQRERRDLFSKASGNSTERDGDIEKSSASIKANSLKIRYEKESERLNKEIQDLNDELTARDFIIQNQQYQFDNFSSRLSEVTANLNKVETQLEQERAKNKQQQIDFQAELKLNREKLAKMQQQQLRIILESIDKKMSRFRSKKLQSSSSELQRTMLAGSYRQFSDILGEVMREQSP